MHTHKVCYPIFLDTSNNIAKKTNYNINLSVILAYIWHTYGLSSLPLQSILQDNPLLDFKTKDILKRNLKKAVSDGLISFIDDPEVIKYQTIMFSTTQNRVQNTINTKKCEWCSSYCFSLDSHHYPIQKIYGGEQTVNICNNCHTIYHSLANSGMVKIINLDFFNKLCQK